MGCWSYIDDGPSMVLCYQIPVLRFESSVIHGCKQYRSVCLNATFTLCILCACVLVHKGLINVVLTTDVSKAAWFYSAIYLVIATVTQGGSR
jgi:hypothetical protein